MANRFSQPVQPYVVNPISVDIFSMIPLAKARAKALGIRATESLIFDFDIDKKDASFIQPEVNKVQTQKNLIIDRIQKEGVSEDLISNFIQIKRQYNAVQEDVGKAEDTKKRIDVWNNKIFALHGKNTNYLQYVKNKEYEQGWKGTFNEDGTINTFDPQLGPQYFDIVEDFTAELARLPSELLEEIKGGGYFSTVRDKTTRQNRTVFVSSQNKRKYGNINNLENRVNALIADYSNITTARGAYSKYSEITPGYISEIATKVMNSLIQERIEGGGVSRQLQPLVSPGGPVDKDDKRLADKSNTWDYPTVTPIPSDAKELEELTESGFISTLKYGFNRAKTWLAHRYGGDYGSVSTAGSVSRLKYKTEVEKLVADKDEYDNMSEDLKAEKMGLFVDRFRDDYDLTMNKLSVKFDNAGFAPFTLDDLEVGFSFEGGELLMSSIGNTDYETDIDLFDEINDYFAEAGRTKTPYTFFQNNASNLFKAQGQKVSNKAYIADVANLGNIVNGNVKVKKLNDNTMLNPADETDSNLLKFLESGMITYSSEGAPIFNGYTIKFEGNGSSSPSLYNVLENDDETVSYHKELAYGTKVRLQKVGKDGTVKEELGDFLIGTRTDIHGGRNAAFEARSGKMEVLANLKFGDILEGKRIRILNELGEPINSHVEIEVNSVVRKGLGANGKLIDIHKGQLVYYTEQDYLPRLYDEADLMQFTFNPNPVKEGSHRIKQSNAYFLNNTKDEVFRQYVLDKQREESRLQQLNR